MMFGRDRKEHDERLRALCERLKKHGLTASPTNCELGVSDLTFFGLKVSSDGIAMGEDKVRAKVRAITINCK